MEGTVVLLHGLGRSSRSMARLEASIAGAGFETRNLAYRSRCCSIREAAEEVSAQLGDLRIEHPLIGVTHSMGGVVMRALASRFNWRGCVMLGPPNHASGLAASTSRMRLFRWLMGPACIELGQELRWPDPPRPCGIIVGTAGMTLDNPPSWLAGLRGVFDHDEVHDGTVSLQEAVHPAATDLALVDASHTRMMDHPETIALVLKFLETGGFGTAGMEPTMAGAIAQADSLHYG
jgi:pimeloyl-ACP methyl ester carboxylesterase